MTKFILLLIIFVFVDGFFKHLNCFDLFIEGVKEALSLFIPILCSLMALMLFVNILNQSHMIEFVTKLPIFQKIAPEIITMMLLRPFSSSGSLLYLDQLYSTYGINHFFSFWGTLIQTGTDSTLYIASLYFAELNLKNEKNALYWGLMTNIFSFIIALILTIIYFLL